MELKAFRKGDVIIEKGSHGTSAYIIKSGRVEVSDLVNGKKIKEQHILKKSINEITVGMHNSPFVFKLEIR
jgi:signal-transduction protein with cAMP-binding, CBS, and nucleotidyltransferase domain